MEKLVVYSKGSNGSTLFSVFQGKVPIFTNKEIDEFSKDLIREYPDICEKIADIYDSDFSIDFPDEINLKQVDQTPRNELVKEIHLKVRQQKV